MSCVRLRFHAHVQSPNQGSEVSLRDLQEHLSHTVTFLVLFQKKAEEKPPSPVPAENMKAEIAFSSHMTPSRRSPVTTTQSRQSPDTVATNRQSPITTAPGKQSPVTATESRRSPLTTTSGRRSPLIMTSTPSRWSPVTAPKAEVTVGLKSETPSGQKTEIEHDIVSPDGDTVVEERQTIAVKPSPVVEDGKTFCFPVKWNPFRKGLTLNPIALRKAKIVYNFGLSGCNRVKGFIFIRFDLFVYIR